MLPRADRPGTSLAELLLALTITLLIGSVLLGLLLAQLALARMTAQQAYTAEAVRTASHVLAAEVRRARPQDVRALARDSLAIRSFRGTGIVCSASGADVHVRYRGERLPDARKDSVLLLPSERAVQLVDARAATAGCAVQPGERALTLRLPVMSADDVAVLIFEPGAYYLTASALRYRLGGEGRQPLTTEAFVHPQTRFESAAGAVRFQLAHDSSHTRVLRAAYAPR